MKLKAFITAFIISSTVAVAQNDPTIMTINGKSITRSEFEYSYNKNNDEGVMDKKSVAEYVDLFVNYKLKVEAALDARLDTLTSFKQEFMSYRDQQIRPSFITDADIDAKALEIYKESQQRINANGGMYRCAHILIGLHQNATDLLKRIAKDKADSVYNALINGADFAEMAKKHSTDESNAANGGELPLISKGQTVVEFENALMAMKPGELSQPVLTPFGYHIIKYISHEDFPPFEELKNNIIKFIEVRGIREQIIDQRVKMLAEQSGGLTNEQILERKLAEMEAKDPTLRNLVKEYYEGLLLFEISNIEVWDKATKDENGLQNYFKKHKKKYTWSEPRFKGIAYHVKNNADVKAVRNALKGVAFKDWAEKLRTTFNNDSTIRIRVEKGLFKEGTNSLIDKEVFKKNVDRKPLKDYPIDAVYGKLLKAPKEMEDVKGLVVSDYQEELEKQWINALRKKYTVVVNQDILSTVNKH